MNENDENREFENSHDETGLAVQKADSIIIDNDTNTENDSITGDISNAESHPKSKKFLVIMIGVMLISIIGLVASILIFGMPNTGSYQFDLPFLNNQPKSTYSPSTTNTGEKTSTLKPANSCGGNRVKLITTASTVGGASERCFANDNDSVYMDTTAAVASVSCPAGTSKSQSGNTGTLTVTVDCVHLTNPDYSINQKATFSDGISITITGVQRNYIPTYTMTIMDKPYTSETKPDSGKEYIAITLKIDNGSGKTYDYGSTYGWRVQDSNKFQYDEAMFVATNEEDLLGNGHLGDGGTVSGKIIYEIPSGDSDLKLIIGTATFNLQ